MKKFIAEIYFSLGMKLGFIGLHTTQGTITFKAWNGKTRKFDNIQEFHFIPPEAK